jgi:hypothetical protein
MMRRGGGPESLEQFGRPVKSRARESGLQCQAGDSECVAWKSPLLMRRDMAVSMHEMAAALVVWELVIDQFKEFPILYIEKQHATAATSPQRAEVGSLRRSPPRNALPPSCTACSRTKPPNWPREPSRMRDDRSQQALRAQPLIEIQ